MFVITIVTDKLKFPLKFVHKVFQFYLNKVIGIKLPSCWLSTILGFYTMETLYFHIIFPGTLKVKPIVDVDDNLKKKSKISIADWLPYTSIMEFDSVSFLSDNLKYKVPKYFMRLKIGIR